MKIQIRRLCEQAVLPTRGSRQAAGYDLYSAEPEPVGIAPHATARIGTGVAIAIPEGYFGGIFARSGLASKRSLRPANCVGVIDADYRGEIICAIHNDSDETQTIEPGERMAQLVVMPFLRIDFEETDTLPDTGRGEGGFGSTGSR